MALTYLAPAAAGAVRPPASRRCWASLAWALMAIAFQPTLRFYRLSPLWGLALPADRRWPTWSFTLESALQYARGRGGMWKGRVQADGVAKRDDDRRRTALRQGPPGREFPGRLVADRAAPPRRRSWPSTTSCAPPTTSPIIRRLPPAEKLDAARPAGGDAARPAATPSRRRVRCATRSPSAACRRSTRRTCSTAFRMRRHQAALRRLGRPDGLLPLFGDAGRPLRARRARREPRHLAGQRRALRRAADHQSPAGLRPGLPQSRPRLYPARCARRARRRASRTLGAPRRRRQLRACLTTLAERTDGLLRKGDALCRPDRGSRGSRSKSRSSSTLAERSDAHAAGARSVARARASRQAGTSA